MSISFYPGLSNVPVEVNNCTTMTGMQSERNCQLLYKIQLYALSETLPHVSRYFYRVFKSAPSSFHAEYILGRAVGDDVVTRALRYPLSTMKVFAALCRHADRDGRPLRRCVPELPKRLFRQLNLPGQASEWTQCD